MEGAKEAAPKAETRPAFCMQCQLKKPTTPLPIFINVTHCQEVAEAYRDESAKEQKVKVPGLDDKSADDKGDDDLTGMRIPIARTKETPSSDPKVPSVYEVAVNSLVVLRAAKDPAFKRMLEMTVMAAAAQFFKLDLSPNYTMASEKFKGDKTEPVLLSPLQKRGPGGGAGMKGQESAGEGAKAKKPLIQEMGPNAASAGSKGAKDGGKTGGVGTGGKGGGNRDGASEGASSQPLKSLQTPEALLESLRNRNGTGGCASSVEAEDGHLNLPSSGTAPKGTGGGGKVLIEEVVTEPEYRLEVRGEQLVLTVEMPLAGGVGEMDLIVSEREVSVKSYHYSLKVALDTSVDSDGVSAKFNKKSKCLVLKLPVIS
mmetsp:Transcript_28775/g.70531  ORF Transcript_28775/g.70531 Transcript_28775/m.70531 type:complete len:371 (+) Transcript_28775:480-1592(+)